MVAQTLRRLILVILIFAMAGAFADLLLLKHFGDVWQMIPLALLGAAALTIVGHLLHGSATSVRGIRVAMLLLVAGGISGVVLHFRSSAEFHEETDATLGGAQLVCAVLQSKVPPTLAPASLLQMGLLGLAYTFHHPKLAARSANGQKETT